MKVQREPAATKKPSPSSSPERGGIASQPGARADLRAQSYDAQVAALSPVQGAPAATPVVQRHEGHEAQAPDERHAGTAPGAVSPLAPKTRAEALANHAAKQKLVYDVIRAGLAIPKPTTTPQRLLEPDVLYRNAAEWIAEGEAEVSVLTSTDQADQRARNMFGSDVAVFDARTTWPATGGSYAVGADDGITTTKDYLHGGMRADGKTLTFVNPGDATQVRAVLIHEVQHDADQTAKGGAWAQSPTPEALGEIDETTPQGKTDKAELPQVWNNYQSEFRAYWIMGPGSGIDFGDPNDKPFNHPPIAGRTPSFKTQRQEAIFRHIVSVSGYKVEYFYARSQAFRAMVESYTLPIGGNLLDSVRIERLSRAIAACTPATDPTTPEYRELMTRASELDPADRKFLGAKGNAAHFWKQARASLGDAVRDELEQHVLTRHASPAEAARLSMPADEPGKNRVSPRKPMD